MTINQGGQRDDVGAKLLALEQFVSALDRSQAGVGSAAHDWRRFDDRMNWAICLFRSRQQDRTLYWPPYSIEDTRRIVAGDMPRASGHPGQAAVMPPLDPASAAGRAVGNLLSPDGEGVTNQMESLLTNDILDVMRKIGDPLVDTALSTMSGPQTSANNSSTTPRKGGFVWFLKDVRLEANASSSTFATSSIFPARSRIRTSSRQLAIFSHAWIEIAAALLLAALPEAMPQAKEPPCWRSTANSPRAERCRPDGSLPQPSSSSGS